MSQKTSLWTRTSLSLLMAGLLACVAAIGSTGCTMTGRMRTSGVVVYSDPPPPRRVVVVRDQYPGYVYVDGNWYWDDYYGQWVWNEGYWVEERPGYSYRAGRWEHRGNGYVWREPHWTRPGHPTVTIKARGTVKVKAKPGRKVRRR